MRGSKRASDISSLEPRTSHPSRLCHHARVASNLHRGLDVRRPGNDGATSELPLRVGLIVDAITQPAWMSDFVERLRRLPGVRLSLHLAPAVQSRRKSWYARLDRILFARRERQTRPVHLPEELMERLDGGDGQLDILLSFVPDPPSIRSRLGTWQCELGRPGDIDAGVTEFVSGAPTIEGRVRRVDDGALLATIRAGMNPFSAGRARLRLATKMSARLVALVEAAARGPLPTRPGSLQPPGPRRRVTPVRLAAAAAAFAKGKVREKLTRDHWFMAFAFGAGGLEAASHLQAFRRIIPPRDRLWADPFPLFRDGRYFLFFEELVYAERRGVIVVSELFRDGRLSEPVRVLGKPWHLSYPHVFEWNGGMYMVPESGMGLRVELFRAADFPLRWESQAILLAGFDAADPTVFEHEGRWWMYLSRNPGGHAYDELHIYHADSPLGPWLPHRLNPVLNDVTAARCGGAPFRDGGRLIRAVQDGARAYGHTLRLREIVTLTPDAWEEREVAVIPPAWAPRLAGTHTFNVAGDLTVVDGYRWRMRL